MSNLEPIEDSDLDLKGKFIGSENSDKNISPEGKKPELVPVSPLEKVEKKEGQAEKEKSYSKILSKIKSPSQSEHDHLVNEDAKLASEEISAEGKIEKLTRLAMDKGVAHAVKVARHLEDNYTLDEFHDKLLADELHDALVKKGLIREI